MRVKITSGKANFTTVVGEGVLNILECDVKLYVD